LFPPHTQAKDNGAKTKELGAYAEYALALETQLAIIPSNIGFGEAAALAKVPIAKAGAGGVLRGVDCARVAVSRCVAVCILLTCVIQAGLTSYKALVW